MNCFNRNCTYKKAYIRRSDQNVFYVCARCQTESVHRPKETFSHWMEREFKPRRSTFLDGVYQRILDKEMASQLKRHLEDDEIHPPKG